MKPSTFNRRLAKLLAEAPNGAYSGAILIEKGGELRINGSYEVRGVICVGNITISPLGFFATSNNKIPATFQNPPGIPDEHKVTKYPFTALPSFCSITWGRRDITKPATTPAS